MRGNRSATRVADQVIVPRVRRSDTNRALTRAVLLRVTLTFPDESSRDPEVPRRNNGASMVTARGIPLHMATVRIIGPGRAGGSFALALSSRGWSVAAPVTRDDDPTGAAAGVDLVVIATPDNNIADVARRITPVPSTVIAHLSGSLGLSVLAPHTRRAALHPLAPLPRPEAGAKILTAECRFAIAGDPMAARIVADLGGISFEVADQDRAAYHAAATIASNHLVSLLGQVERIAGSIGLPLDAYLGLAATALQNVNDVGPTRALTGPVARQDWGTVRRHLEALSADEIAMYEVLASGALRLAEPSAVDKQPWRSHGAEERQ